MFCGVSVVAAVPSTVKVTTSPSLRLMIVLPFIERAVPEMKSCEMVPLASGVPFTFTLKVIVEAVGGNQSAVSHQLRILRDNRIIKARRDGQNIVYSLADAHVLAVLELALAHINCGEAAV